MNRQDRLNYREQGHGEVVVILHGLFGSMDNLSPTARRLSENYRVISVDLRNHGRSFHRAEMSYPEMAQDVVDLLNELMISETIVLGHSMGGKVAMQMALDYPEKVRALIVGDIAPVTYEHRHKNVLAAINNYRPEQAHSRKEADQQLANYIEMTSVRQLLIKSMLPNAKGELVWRINAQALIDNYDNIRGMPDNIGKIFKGPTLFIKGAVSDYLLPEYWPIITRYFPQAEIKVVDNVGHWLHAEKPALFNGVVIRFLTHLEKFK